MLVNIDEHLITNADEYNNESYQYQSISIVIDTVLISIDLWQLILIYFD